MLVTVLGKDNDVICVLYKAYVPNDVTPLGIGMDVKPVHP